MLRRKANAGVNYHLKKITTTFGEVYKIDARKGKKNTSSNNTKGSGVSWGQFGALLNNWLQINPNIQITIQ